MNVHCRVCKNTLHIWYDSAPPDQELQVKSSFEGRKIFYQYGWRWDITRLCSEFHYSKKKLAGETSNVILEKSSSTKFWEISRSAAVNEGTVSMEEDLASRYSLKVMMSYCERSLNRIKSIEKHLNDSYKNKLKIILCVKNDGWFGLFYLRD